MPEKVAYLRNSIALCVALSAGLPSMAVADRIVSNFPAGQLPGPLGKQIEMIEQRLAEQLAPAPPGTDELGRRFFAGRVLKMVPAVNPSAPPNDPDRWPRVVFEGYGPGGAPKSLRPALISMMELMPYGIIASDIDTVDDIARLMSNRHRVIGAGFGSPEHRQAVFAALDPDGSMGLSDGAADGLSSGVEEGALMIFGRQGVPRDQNQRFMMLQTNPLDPILYFGGDPGADDTSIGIPADLLDEYARSQRYPGYEPEFAGMAKATLQVFYSLSVAVPDLASPDYRDWAARYQVVGRSMFDALSQALDYHHSDEANRQFRNGLNPFLPLTVDEVRLAALEVLADGPVVPVPAVSHQGRLVESLIQVIENDETLAPMVQEILERQLAPGPGEPEAVTALHEVDRETYQAEARDVLFDDLSGNPRTLIAGRALARIGWGAEKDAEQLAETLVTITLQDVGGHMDLVALLRMMARPKIYTREDRQEYANVAANVLDRRLAEVRTDIQRGFGGVDDARLIELMDAPDE